MYMFWIPHGSLHRYFVTFHLANWKHFPKLKGSFFENIATLNFVEKGEHVYFFTALSDLDIDIYRYYHVHVGEIAQSSNRAKTLSINHLKTMDNKKAEKTGIAHTHFSCFMTWKWRRPSGTLKFIRIEFHFLYEKYIISRKHFQEFTNLQSRNESFWKFLISQ